MRQLLNLATGHVTHRIDVVIEDARGVRCGQEQNVHAGMDETRITERWPNLRFALHVRLEYLVSTGITKGELFEQCSNRIGRGADQDFDSTRVDSVCSDIEGWGLSFGEPTIQR